MACFVITESGPRAIGRFVRKLMFRRRPGWLRLQHCTRLLVIERGNLAKSWGAFFMAKAMTKRGETSYIKDAQLI